MTFMLVQLQRSSGLAVWVEREAVASVETVPDASSPEESLVRLVNGTGFRVVGQAQNIVNSLHAPPLPVRLTNTALNTKIINTLDEPVYVDELQGNP